ncbi:MAG: acetyl-CoA synthase subunit gamma [Planctomycetes bacterium]|nr:acetyl-CoA synthase subunit gamma [Planctomycetota bacterium]
MLRVRFGFARMSYGVEPGLYALGQPNASSPVLVTANYKLSVDLLRRELGGRELWILVLDTAKVNVWCAAGKGSFGTAELLRSLAAVGLDRQVNHRRLILPQLGAPGVAAHEVLDRSGFEVVYGPVRAADLPAFLDAQLQATPEMRRVRFSLLDRLVLTPVELRRNFPMALLLAVLLGLAPYLLRCGWAAGLADYCGRGVVIAFTVWFLGGLAGPLLLPWLPGRAFFAKGACLGAVGALFLLSAGLGREWKAGLGAFLITTAGVSFLLMNFTGCSTFTSESGVKFEMKALPWLSVAGILGLLLWCSGSFVCAI